MPEPTKIPRPFADSGDKNSIPDSSGSIGFASWQEGFPAITSEPFAQGGVAPKRADFNGIFNAISAATLWYQQGGVYAYDNTTNYEVGNIVVYNGDLYKCLVANGPSSTVIAPTNTTVWDKIATASGYLSLSGGTLSGNLSFSNASPYIGTSSVNEYLRLLCNGAFTGGGSLYLYGTGNSTNPGGFALNTHDGGTRRGLIGKTDGSLQWNSADVACVSDVDSTTSGYIRFTNGLQLVWGSATVTSGNESTGVAVSFEKAFSDTPRIFTNVLFSSAYGYGMTVQAISRSSTDCTLVIGSSKGGTTQAYSSGSVIYFAIGPWA